MRMNEPPISPAELARRAGADSKTVRAFLRGERWPHDATLAKFDRALGNPPGTISAWAAGDDTIGALVPAPAQRRTVVTIDQATELELARALLARLEARRSASPGNEIGGGVTYPPSDMNMGWDGPGFIVPVDELSE